MQTETVIHHNGWNSGGAPHPIEHLCKLLATEPLDPTFEEYGNFASNMGRGVVQFFGNFYNYSNAFRIDSSDPVVVERLITLIKANIATVAYKAARIERRAYVAKRMAEHRG